MDWSALHLHLLEQFQPHLPPLQAIAIDATFVPKSGKRTFGLAHFWDSAQQRAHKGLEVSLLALVEADGARAWAWNALQPPAEFSDKLNRCAHSLHHLRQERDRMPASVRHVLADGLYANPSFVWGVLDPKLHLVTKLRKDANLRYLYVGPQKARGRRREYDEKVDFADWSRCARSMRGRPSSWSSSPPRRTALGRHPESPKRCRMPARKASS